MGGGGGDTTNVIIWVVQMFGPVSRWDAALREYNQSYLFFSILLLKKLFDTPEVLDYKRSY